MDQCAELPPFLFNITAEGSRVGARLIRKRGGSAAQQRRELRALATILCAVVLPLLGAFLLVSADMRTDLSELIPDEALPDHTAVLIGWADLAIPESGTVSLEQKRWQDGRRVRMLGYMIDGYNAGKPSRDGAAARMFVLMPEAGHPLHPAHHIPDQMVEVWPQHPVTFRFRAMVWSTGILERTVARPSGEDPLYAMTAADVEPAVQSDITLWFRP